MKQVKQMVVLITGASHTGKTLLAQKLLEKYKLPYLSIDHLKMGLIRSGYTELTPEDDDALTDYLWPIIREMIKTAIENGQNLTIEGCYIPLDWEKDFDAPYLAEIQCYCLVLSAQYIKAHFSDIQRHACAIEKRRSDGDCTLENILKSNAQYLALAQRYGVNYVLVEDRYEIDLDLSCAAIDYS